MKYMLLTPVCLFVSAIALAAPAQAQGGAPNTGAEPPTATGNVAICYQLVKNPLHPRDQNGNVKEEWSAMMPCSKCPAGPTTTMGWCDGDHNCRDIVMESRCVSVQDYHGD